MGLARDEALRLRPVVREHARLDGLVAAPGSVVARAAGLSAVAASADAAAERHRGAASRRRAHGALLPAGRRVRQRHVGGDAGLAQQVDALALGSDVCGHELDWLGHPLHPATARLGEPVLPRHEDRHHRIQLGRREPHQRRDDAGGCAGDLRPRVIGHGRPLDDSRHGHADLQSHQDLPELRRSALGVRRHERENDLVVES